ncbi:hypothetical protein [Niveispirillum sp. KHB5.9]|uniref:hypothetical protein n=1 Tax=Niveispirillum sp. KHB5.9 TaxID=3400269 RepID=UPI003A8B97A3
MTTRKIRQAVRFRRPFGLPGIDGPLPAGEYEIETEEERVDGLSFPAWQRVATTLHLTEIAKGYGFALRIEPEVLDAIITADEAVPSPPTLLDDVRTHPKRDWLGSTHRWSFPQPPARRPSSPSSLDHSPDADG